MLLSSSSDQKGKGDPCPSLASLESEGVLHFSAAHRSHVTALVQEPIKGTHTALFGSVDMGSDMFY